MDESLGSLLSAHCLTQSWPKGSRNSGVEISSPIQALLLCLVPEHRFRKTCAQVFLWDLAGVVTLQVFSSASLSISQSFGWNEQAFVEAFLSSPINISKLPAFSAITLDTMRHQENPKHSPPWFLVLRFPPDQSCLLSVFQSFHHFVSLFTHI